MRAADDALLDALRWSFSREIVVDVFNGSTRVMDGLAFTAWSLTWDHDARVKASGSGTIVHNSVRGESIIPTGVNGVLSPFRARLVLSMLVTAGEFQRKVQLGWFTVKAVTSGYDTIATFNGVDRVVTSTVTVDLESLDAVVDAAGFTSPEQPPQTGSVYAEMRRIGILPVREGVDDFGFGSGFTWESERGARLNALHDLAAVGGAVPVVDSSGMWTLTPSEPGDTDGTLQLGELGTVLDIGYMVDTDGIYNEVIGDFETDTGVTLHAEARIVDGPMSVDRWGAHTRFFSSPVIQSQAAANSAVESLLQTVSGSQVYDVPVSCVVNPLPEIGDTWAVEGHTSPITGLVTRVAMGDGELMDVTLRVRVPLR